MLKVLSFVLSGFFVVSTALDLELAEEGFSCRKDLVSLPLDPSLVQKSSVTWFNPIISKYDLYQYAEAILGRKLEAISDQELKRLCPTFTFEFSEKSSSFETLGSDGSHVTYDGALGENNTLLYRVKGQQQWERSWITKIGNNYFVILTCFQSGQMTVAVTARFNKLWETEKNEITEHLKTIGFTNPKYLYQYSYDECEKVIYESQCLRSYSQK